MVMVNVGKENEIESGYWSKVPGRKTVFVSSPARQPTKWWPVGLKTVQCHNAKPMSSRTGKYSYDRDKK